MTLQDLKDAFSVMTFLVDVKLKEDPKFDLESVAPEILKHTISIVMQRKKGMKCPTSTLNS